MNANPAYPFDVIQAKMRRLALGRYPSPISRQSELLGLPNVDVWLKNDGVCSEGYAGNKVRKLEILLADAVVRDAKHIITLGSAGSNHAVATSTYAKKLNLQCTVCMVHQPTSEIAQKNLLRHLHLGTELRLFGTLAEAKSYADEAASQPDTYMIPLGGSAPFASMGYVFAAAELAQQLTAQAAPMPHRIYLACGTMGTAVGLTLGLALLKLPITVVAVRVTEPSVASPKKFAALYRDSVLFLNTLDPQFNFSTELQLGQLIFEEGFFGQRYGQPTRRAEAAIERASSVGLYLDGTYTGKALSALIHDAENGLMDHPSVLFWNTLNAMDTPIAPIAEHKKLGEEFNAYFDGCS